MNLIEKRKEFEAKRERLAMIFKQAGPDREMEKVTLIEGDANTKVAQITRMSKELEDLDTEVKRAALVEAEERKNEARFKVEMPEENPEGGKKKRDVRDPYTGDIKNFGHFVQMVISEPGKLKAMGIDSGEAGGFAVPDQFVQRILMVPPMDAIVRPRANVLPPGEYPDAKLELPALRQGASGLYGGVSFSAVNEGAAGTSNDPKLDLVSLEPQRISGYVTVGNSLLRNATAMSAFIETLFRNAKAGYEDYQFIQGAGGALPLGMLNSPAKVQVVRTTAATVVFADIANMLAKQYGSSPIWICNKSALPKMIGMADTVGNSIFIVGDITKGISAQLAGYPIFFTFRNPALGTEGDLMLVDPSYYLVKDGSGPFIQASEHVQFTSDQTIIKLSWWMDAQPWVKTALRMEDGVTDTSPIVVLK
jgi:HK97 family phage major capsid protein